VCVQKPFCINFYARFSLFVENLSKDERGRFWARNIEKYHLRSLWRSVVAVTVRRWHHSEAAEERWGSLTKCWVTKCVTDRRSRDGLSCWFVVMIREVVPVPIFQEFKCYGTETFDEPFCLWRSIIPSVEGNEESSRRICNAWDDSVHDGPSWPQRLVARSVDPAAFWQIFSK